MNKVEKQIVGEYVLKEYKLSVDTPTIYPILKLKKDKTFVIQKGVVKYCGDWFARDCGDFTLIYFEDKNGYKDEGKVYFEMDTVNGNNSFSKIKISFGAPSFHFFPEFNKMSFVKIDEMPKNSNTNIAN